MSTGNKALDELASGTVPITFLAGAGISVDPPACVPSARQISQDLLEFFGPMRSFQEFQSIKNLRYEKVIETVQHSFDSKLSIMDYFDLIKYPNIIHLFLATVILKGKSVITTNFDFLIEHALKTILPEPQHGRITPVITRDDFLTIGEKKKENRLLLYKIHGSTKNFITGADTSGSLVTTITALGKNRDSGQTFGLESFKQPAISGLLDGHVVIVMGYSGSDDFDITPALRAAPGIRGLIWIEHANVEQAEVSMLSREPTAGGTRHPIWNMLPAAAKFNVILIKANTGKLVREALIPLFARDLAEKIEQIQQQLLDASKQAKIPTFNAWLYDRYEDPLPAHAMHFASLLYYDTGNVEQAWNQCRAGLHAARMDAGNASLSEKKRDSLKKLEGWFLNQAGIICVKKELYADALDTYKNCFEAAKAKGDLADQSSALNNQANVLSMIGEWDQAKDVLKAALQIDLQQGEIKASGVVLANLGDACKRSGDFEGAIKYMQEALTVAVKEGDLNGKAIRLNNLGALYSEIDRFDDAMKAYEEALSIAKALGDVVNTSICEKNIASFKEFLKDKPEIRKFNQEAARFMVQNKVLVARATFLYQKGKKFFDFGPVPNGVPLLGEAAEIARKIKLYNIFARSANLLGKYYVYSQEKDKGLDLLADARKCVPVLVKDEVLEKEICANLGLAYFMKGQHEAAIEENAHARDLAIKQNDASLIPDMFLRMAKSYLALKKKDQAREHSKKAEEYFLANKDRIGAGLAQELRAQVETTL
jgi:tetratricopeptide (TPR) repeat protein